MAVSTNSIYLETHHHNFTSSSYNYDEIGNLTWVENSHSGRTNWVFSKSEVGSECESLPLNIGIAARGSSQLFKSGISQFKNTGLTNAGRALQKHAGRPDPFNSIKFSHKTGSQQGLDVLNSILNSKNPIIQNAGNGGYRIFDGATGRGFGLSRNGLFNGFRQLL